MSDKAAKEKTKISNKKKRISHDQNFKQIIRAFFAEFMELFFESCFENIDWQSMPPINRELDREMDSDATDASPRRVDVLMRVKNKLTDSEFIVHVEVESSEDAGLPKRMHRYFAKLHARYKIPIYPIVVFSFGENVKLQRAKYELTVVDLDVLDFAIKYCN